MVGSIDKNLCIGCKMCGDLCKTNAITFKIDNEGFWYPAVNEDKCIKCKQCIKRCPGLTKIENYNEFPQVYAAWSKSDDTRLSSTSGGVYYELAKYILKSGGYIAGCIYNDDFKGAEHVVSNSMDGLKKIMGSKYFQSDTAGIYIKVKKLLDEDNLVLFCGAPCQCAALVNFLGNKYENLITVDFICRGINSPKAFYKYISELEQKYKSKAKFVRLKDKKTGWQSLASYVKFENGKEYHKDRYQDWWIRGYICGNLYMRPSCHACKFKELPRVADITIGDFWGIKGCDNEALYKGVSSVLLNSSTGKRLFNSIKTEITFSERSLEEVSNGNPYLLRIAQKGKNRDEFFMELDKYNFSQAVKNCYELTTLEKFKDYLRKIKYKLKILGRKYL